MRQLIVTPVIPPPLYCMPVAGGNIMCRRCNETGCHMNQEDQLLIGGLLLAIALFCATHAHACTPDDALRSSHATVAGTPPVAWIRAH